METALWLKVKKNYKKVFLQELIVNRQQFTKPREIASQMNEYFTSVCDLKENQQNIKTRFYKNSILY